MRKFHTLKVVAKERETEDSVRLSIDVPEALRGEFEMSDSSPKVSPSLSSASSTSVLAPGARRDTLHRPSATMYR